MQHNLPPPTFSIRVILSLHFTILPVVDIRRTPRFTEYDSGVDNRQRGGGDDDHCALQDHERDLIVRKVALKPALEFGNTETRADVNGEEGHSNA